MRRRPPDAVCWAGMHARLLTSADDLARVDAWMRGQPQGSLWQSLAWKGYQETLGRSTRMFSVETDGAIAAACLAVIDRTALGLTTWDVPRGPVWAAGREAEASVLLGALIEAAQAEGALSIVCSAPLPPPSPLHGLRPSGRHVYPEATRIIDLTPGEDAILAQMHSKGRYNIRIAERDGVEVRPSTDAAAFHTLLRATAERDGFRPPSLKACEAFLGALPGSFLLLASAPASTQPGPIAGLLGVAWEGTGIYYYGASDHAHRALMAPYALQWAAMRHCKAAGCTSYDLLGVAPPGAGVAHPWQGISGFKEKFGGAIRTYPPELRRVLRPVPTAVLWLKRAIMG